jgi:hypothetical protein
MNFSTSTIWAIAPMLIPAEDEFPEQFQLATPIRDAARV